LPTLTSPFRRSSASFSTDRCSQRVEVARWLSRDVVEVADALNLLAQAGLAHQADELYSASLAARTAREMLAGIGVSR
jgi:hypothetical protein